MNYVLMSRNIEKMIQLECGKFSDFEEYYLKQADNPIFIATVRYRNIGNDLEAFIVCRLQKLIIFDQIALDQIRDCLEYMMEYIILKHNVSKFNIEGKKQLSKDIEENVFGILGFLKTDDGTFSKTTSQEKKR